MNGSIRRRGKNTWELNINLGRDAQGKRLRKFVNVRGKRADADRRLREILASVDKGLPIDNTKNHGFGIARPLVRELRHP